MSWYKILISIMIVIDVLLSMTGIGFSQSVSIDSVNGLLNNESNVICSECEITFYIRVKNNTTVDMVRMSNGFRIYSPDSAKWTDLQVDTIYSGWSSFFDIQLDIYNSYTSNNICDTIGFYFLALRNSGLPAGFDDLAYSIHLDNFDNDNHGKTICIDSSYFSSGGEWIWASPKIIPSWLGPYCYEIAGEDSDLDMVADIADNCPENYNPEQLDTDNDGYGNVCDNCPDQYNPDQSDTSGNGVGDVCDDISTDIYDNISEIPNNFVLAQNYPNPFNPLTMIDFNIPVNSDVSLIIYNQLGQRVRTLLNEHKPAGSDRAFWDGKNNKKEAVASGIYFYILKTDSVYISKKMVLLR